MRIGPSNEVVLPLRSLFDALTDGILVTNEAGERTYSNPALDKLVGTDARLPLNSAAPPSFLPAVHHDRYRKHVVSARRGETLSLEWTIEAAGGEEVPVVVKTMPVRVNGSSTPAAHFWLFVATAPTTDVRVVALERALDRIAHEVNQVSNGSSLASRSARLPVELSARESEVVSMLMEGHRVASVAEILCVSPHTVRNHLKSVFRKLGVHSQAELIRLIRDQG